MALLSIIAAISFVQFFFLTLYAYFPPNTDEYTSWLGRQIPASTSFILVDYNTTAEDGLNGLIQRQYTTVTHSDLETNPGQLSNWKNFVAFVDDREQAEWIAGKIPASKVQAAYVPGQRLRGYVVTDTQMNVSMDLSLSAWSTGFVEFSRPHHPPRLRTGHRCALRDEKSKRQKNE